MPHFLIELAKGPSWDHAKERREQTGWEEHAAYMDELVAAGTIVLGGPVGDGEKVLLVVEVADEAALRAALARDPWFGGILEIEDVRPWTIWLKT